MGKYPYFPKVQSTWNKKQKFDSISIKEDTTPSNPDSDYEKIYFKSDGELYKLNSSGVESVVGGSSGGGQEGDMIVKQDKGISAYNNTDVSGVVSSGADYVNFTWDINTSSFSGVPVWTTTGSNFANTADGNPATYTSGGEKSAGAYPNGSGGSRWLATADAGEIITGDITTNVRFWGGRGWCVGKAYTSTDNATWTEIGTIPSTTLTNQWVEASTSAVGRTYRYIKYQYSTDWRTYINKMQIGELSSPKILCFDDNTATKWTSNSESTPYVIANLQSAKEISGVALNLDTANTTVNEIKIQYSVDDTFTDSDTIRTVSVSDFTDNTWRFLAIPRRLDNRQYVKISGIGTGVLSIYEIKFLELTADEYTRAHYHSYLDPDSLTSNDEDTN